MEICSVHNNESRLSSKARQHQSSCRPNANWTGTIFVGDPEVQVEEGAGTIQAKISRAGSLAGEVVITYGITTDTATAGQDFVGSSGTVTMPDGAAEVSVAISILDDAAGEGTESLILSLINVDGPAALVAPRTSRISILDDEAPTPPCLRGEMNEVPRCVHDF